jgi:multicomponent Na+:H+ antiporter subunit B
VSRLLLRRLITVSVLIVFIVLTSYTITALNVLGELPPRGLRPLALWFLNTSITPWLNYFSAMAPETVTAIVWDYRGLDTLFETAVFYFAIIASIALFRGIEEKRGGGYVGLSKIVRVVSRVLLPINIVVAASIAIHGTITPGGGFQAGSAMAVAPLILIIVFSRFFLKEKGLSKNLLIALRGAGLVGIGVASILALALGLLSGEYAFIFQNQPKEAAPTGLPPDVLGFPIAGTLFIFNICEFIAVFAGFTIIFILLSIPEDVAREALHGEH